MKKIALVIFSVSSSILIASTVSPSDSQNSSSVQAKEDKPQELKKIYYYHHARAKSSTPVVETVDQTTADNTAPVQPVTDAQTPPVEEPKKTHYYHHSTAKDAQVLPAEEPKRVHYDHHPVTKDATPVEEPATNSAPVQPITDAQTPPVEEPKKTHYYHHSTAKDAQVLPAEEPKRVHSDHDPVAKDVTPVEEPIGSSPPVEPATDVQPHPLDDSSALPPIEYQAQAAPQEAGCCQSIFLPPPCPPEIPPAESDSKDAQAPKEEEKPKEEDKPKDDADDDDKKEDDDDKPKSPHTFTANVNIVSDYRFRGISQTMRRPAIQGGFDYSYVNGFYVGTWASNVDGTCNFFNNTSMEWDFYGGFKKSLCIPCVKDKIGINVGLYGYYYPGGIVKNRDGNRYDTGEFYCELSYKWLAVKYWQTFTDYFGINNYNTPFNWSTLVSDRRNGGSVGSNYIEANISLDLFEKVCYFNTFQGAKINLLIHVGHQTVRHYSHISYTDWRATLTQDFDWFSLFITYVGTDANRHYFDIPDNAYHPSRRDLGASGVVVGITKTWP